MFKTKRRVFFVFIAALQLCACAEEPDQAGELSALLDAFLVGATEGSETAHDRFWADDLVYTSSNGTRTTKQAILDQVRAASAEPASDNASTAPSVIYSAKDVDIRQYGDTAIIAFRLVGAPADPDSETLQYFNTGTFLKRDGRWQAVAWQATVIPKAAEPG